MSLMYIPYLPRVVLGWCHSVQTSEVIFGYLLHFPVFKSSFTIRDILPMLIHDKELSKTQGIKSANKVAVIGKVVFGCLFSYSKSLDLY